VQNEAIKDCADRKRLISGDRYRRPRLRRGGPELLSFTNGALPLPPE